jgi:hypothetical protein
MNKDSKAGATPRRYDEAFKREVVKQSCAVFSTLWWQQLPWYSG